MENFRFVMPAELSKGKDGEWRVSGLASSNSVDRQGEIILPDGIDASPIAEGKGFFNFDHAQGPEDTIGVLDGYSKTPTGMFVNGRLFKNHTKAKAVYEIMSSLGKSDKGRVGMSVEGKIIERDPFNSKIIKRCVIKNVAITLNPVNTDTYADIIKSFNASEVEFDSTGKNEVTKSDELPTFTATQVLSIVEKALGLGGGAPGANYGNTAPKGMSGGEALSQEGSFAPKKKKKKIKKLEKGLFKSKMIEIIDRLQELYPDNTRSEIWAAVQNRMETTFPEVK